MKLSGPGLLFVGSFLITASVLLPVIVLFKFLFLSGSVLEDYMLLGIYPFFSVSGGSWDVLEKIQPGAVLTRFLYPHKKEFKSERDAGKKKCFIENKSTHLRGKCGNSEKSHPEEVTIRGIYPSQGRNW